jgi:hypothetical protein
MSSALIIGGRLRSNISRAKYLVARHSAAKANSAHYVTRSPYKPFKEQLEQT